MSFSLAWLATAPQKFLRKEGRREALFNARIFFFGIFFLNPAFLLLLNSLSLFYEILLLLKERNEGKREEREATNFEPSESNSIIFYIIIVEWGEMVSFRD